MKSSPAQAKGGATGVGKERPLATTRRYFQLVFDLGADVFRLFPADTIKALVAIGISLCCQVLALVLLYAYVHALESNQPLLGYSPRESVELFVLVAVATALLFFGFILLEFRGNIAIIRLCHRYQEAGVREVLILASKLPHWFAPGNHRGISAGHLRQILSVDVQHRSRMARVLLRAVIPAARLALSAIAIIYINPGFSVLILFIVGVPLAGLYWVGKKIADTITSRETAGQGAYRQQASILARSWEDQVHLLPGDISKELALGLEESRFGQFFRRLRAKTLGQLLINTANTLGILALVLLLGLRVLEESQDNWSLWLTYLVALRYFLSSLNSLAQAVIQSTRFNRQVRRLMEFTAAASLAVADNAQAPCPEHVLAAFKGKGDNTGGDDDFDDD